MKVRSQVGRSRARGASLFLVIAALLSSAACIDHSGDYESHCRLTCTLPDGGQLAATERIACCGVHDNPSHSGEEGEACVPDWVSTRTQALCAARSFYQADGGSYVCPAEEFTCSCEPPQIYPSYQGCN
jgi:hypothetical protein